MSIEKFPGTQKGARGLGAVRDRRVSVGGYLEGKYHAHNGEFVGQRDKLLEAAKQ